MRLDVKCEIGISIFCVRVFRPSVCNVRSVTE